MAFAQVLLSLLLLVAPASVYGGPISKEKKHHHARAHRALVSEKPTKVQAVKSDATKSAAAAKDRKTLEAVGLNGTVGISGTVKAKFRATALEIEQLVDQIDQGEEDAHFSADVFAASKDTTDDLEMYGGCILEKAMDMVNVLSMRDETHIPKIKNALASCCQGRGAGLLKLCLQDLVEPYHKLSMTHEKCGHLMETPYGQYCLDRRAANVAKLLIKVGAPRVKESHLTTEAAFWLARCGSRPGKCMQKVIDGKKIGSSSAASDEDDLTEMPALKAKKVERERKEKRDESEKE